MTDKPDIRLLMDGANVFVPGGSDQIAVCIDARVWNLGEPVAAIDWGLTVIADGVRTKGTIRGINNPIKVEKGPVIQPSESMTDKTYLIPIGKVPVKGRLLFLVPLPKPVIIEAETVWELSVKDIYGTLTTATQRMGDWPR